MLDAIAQLVGAAATVLGYIILSLIALAFAGWLLSKYVSPGSEVSEEAKELADEVDPNTPVERTAAAMVFDGMLEGVRELQPDETVKADPPPVTHFDWSADAARQEEIEHILRELADAGYYVTPLPDIDHYGDESKWSRERAGVWRSPPNWHIVRYDDDGTKHIGESVEVSVPDAWRPKPGRKAHESSTSP
jgi:hypothetical protein